MKVLVTISCVLFFIAPKYSWGCINEFGHTLAGKEVETTGPPGPYHAIGDTSYLRPIKELLERYKRTNDLEDYSDYGAMLVYHGDYQVAKSVFQDIEKLRHSQYNTAANLGTVYELLGQNDSAYFWIKKAIAINPDSHNGSEWIHLRILDLKRRGNTNQQYLANHDILGLDFRDKQVPESNLPLDSLHSIQRHLFDQLQERLSFVKPKEPIVAQLLFDLANLTMLTRDVETAAQEYIMAGEYGYQSGIFGQRKDYAIRLYNSYLSERNFQESHHSYPHIVGRTYGWIDRNRYWIISMGLIAFLSVTSIVRRKKIK